MIKAIVFDCFGVLTTDTWEDFLSTISDGIIVGRLRELNRQLGSGFLNMAEFLEQVSELTGQKPVEIEKLLNNEINKNNELLQYIKELRERRFKIGLLSNVSGNWVRDTFLTREEQDMFDTMVFSYEVHMVKPQPEIFELVCERLDVKATEAVMIDDALGNCDAAESIGMKAIVYDDFRSLKNTIDSLLIL